MIPWLGSSSQARQVTEVDPLEHAVGLLSQQVWCWGRDILRPEGNWLLETGFERLEPPIQHKKCSSVYTLGLTAGRRVVLRGFGVFFSDAQRGGVFLPRYEFEPRYTPEAVLECPPWSDDSLSHLGPPASSCRAACASLVLDLLDWIRGYEVNVVDCLGVDYRRETLLKWNNGKRAFTPAEQLASAWRELMFQVAATSAPTRRRRHEPDRRSSSDQRIGATHALPCPKRHDLRGATEPRREGHGPAKDGACLHRFADLVAG